MTVLSSILKNTQTLSFKMIFAVLDCDLASNTMFKLLSFFYIYICFFIFLRLRTLAGLADEAI